MSAKRLIKKYKKVQTKANELRRKIAYEYEQGRVLNNNTLCKEIINNLYAKDSPIYDDTDSIIYQDFNKKQEI